MEEEVKSKVKPSTVQRTKDGVEVAKNHGVDMVTPLPGVANDTKLPLSPRTRGFIQPVMLEALVKEFLLKLTDPPMLMSPVIGVARAIEGRDKRIRMPATEKTDRTCLCAREIHARNGIFIGILLRQFQCLSQLDLNDNI